MINNYYKERISKVIDYIEDNIGAKLRLDELADVAMFSKYHFHRIFKSVTGEKLNEFIKRTRMIKAYRLLQVDESQAVKDITFALGYNSVANFSRDFKDYHGLSPTEAKYSGRVLEKRERCCVQKEFSIDYRGIEFVFDKYVLYKKITTGYNTEVISETFDELYQLALHHGFKIDQFVGIGYDDPDYTPAEKCKYDACLVVNREDIPRGEELNSKTLVGGKFAVFNFKGHKNDISHAWDYLFKEWLLTSNFVPADRPHLEMYLYSEHYEQGYFNVNLCLPIKILTH